jgi:hypothetical protein
MSELRSEFGAERDERLRGSRDTVESPGEIRTRRNARDITHIRGEAALSSLRPQCRHAGVAWNSHPARVCRVEVSRGYGDCCRFTRRFDAVRDDAADRERRRVCCDCVRGGQTPPQPQSAVVSPSGQHVQSKSKRLKGKRAVRGEADRPFSFSGFCLRSSSSLPTSAQRSRRSAADR